MTRTVSTLPPPPLAKFLHKEDITPLLEARRLEPHPELVQIHAENLAWVESWGLVDDQRSIRRHAGIGTARCAAHVYPHADRWLVRLAADLISWLFLFDDIYGEGLADDTEETHQSRLEKYLEIAEANLPPRDTLPAEINPLFCWSLVELVNRASNLTSAPEFRGRFVESLRTFFDGCVAEFPYRRAGRTPTSHEYRQVRALSIGCYPVFALAELQRGPLSREEAEDPKLVSIRERAALVCAWINDVYSFNKEKNDGDPLNLVRVIASEYGLPDAEAHHAAIEVFNSELSVFEDEILQLSFSLTTPKHQGFLNGLVEWIHGSYSWTGTCGRY